MRKCEICGTRFRGTPALCPLDGGLMVEVPDPLLGKTVAGRYTIEERIGAGGMGVVYRANHEVVGRDVAIKFLASELAYDPKNRTRFLREARAANRIDHEHIIDITDFGETDAGEVYLVMEFLRGRTLNVELAKGPLDPRRAMLLTSQVAGALARAHELDVVHRDLKPDNLFLLEGYERDFIKILDFGLAHMKGELRVTATGTVFGTPEYMSPEQARGAPVTGASDVYSFGVVLYEMLTGKLPFEGGTTDLIFKHLRETPRRPKAVRPDVPEMLDELVMSLLEKDPEQRIIGALELKARAAAYVAESPSLAPQPRALVLAEPTSAMNMAARWRARFEGFVAMREEVRAPGEPAWMGEELALMAEGIAELESVGEVLSERAKEYSRREEEARATRLRLGHAIDALAADHGRIMNELGSMPTRVAEGHARMVQIEPKLGEAWLRAREAIGPRAEGWTDERLEALRDAGALANAFAVAQNAVRGADAERARLEQERGDLAFQIAQMKGRLAALSAGVGLEQDDLREETRLLDARWETALNGVVRRTEPILAYFMKFESLRERIREPGSLGPMQ